MKKTLYLFCIFILFTAVSCIKDEQAYTTFTGDMVYSYLQKDSSYSEFVKILDKAGLRGALSSYSKFTCFAPTNVAMRMYYHSQGKGFSIDSLRPGQLDTLAKFHILPTVHHTYEFTNGVLSSYNMTYDYLEVHFDEQQGGIMMNGSSRIISKDHDVYNGVVHGIDRVLKQMIARLPDLMAQDSSISIFHKALRLTHLSDSLNPIVDIRTNAPKAYYYNYPVGDVASYSHQYRIVQSPQRRFGYTAFVEDNALLEKNGVHNIHDLIEFAKQLYPSENQYETDFTNRNNSLNRYISYHLVNKAIYNNRFFFSRNAISGFIPDEFLETMLKNHIIKVSSVNARVILNLGSEYSSCVQESFEQRTKNGIYYLLEDMLVYSNNVESMLQNTRIRFDIASIIPELTNNNMRGTNVFLSNALTSSPNFDFDKGYLSNIKTNDLTNLLYSTGVDNSQNYSNFQLDMFWIMGQFDVTFRLLPVPPGTYELRIANRAGVSSIVQIYVDNKPIGIPVDFRLFLDHFGFELDENTVDNGIKNDQTLRYHGYMKAPTTFYSGSISDDNGATYRMKVARENSGIYRKIVGIFSFTDYGSHTIRLRSVEKIGTVMRLDYFEFVPKSVFAPPGEGTYETRD